MIQFNISKTVSNAIINVLENYTTVENYPTGYFHEGFLSEMPYFYLVSGQ